jgi:hypothetical protein
MKNSAYVEFSGEGLYEGLELLTDPNGTLNVNPSPFAMFGFEAN